MHFLVLGATFFIKKENNTSSIYFARGLGFRREPAFLVVVCADFKILFEVQCNIQEIGMKVLHINICTAGSSIILLIC